MSTTTIYCTRDTYVSKFSKNSNHAGASKLLTSKTGSDGVIGENTVHSALLQFAIPKEIQYKQITKAVLHYYYGSALPATATMSGVYYTPYLIDNTTNAITYNTVGSQGTLGENKKVSRTYSSGDWIAEDITDIFTNNLINGIFSVFIGAGLSMSSDNETEPYAYIGGIAGSMDSYLVITYEDVEQLPPTITYPVDVYVRQGEPVLFSWVYNSLTAATQATVTLEWKAVADAAYNVITLDQTAQSYMADIEFPAGTIDWRIKVTNDVGETSAYAEAKFVVIGKPAIPVITGVKNQTLTEITWNASDQCVYEIILSDSKGNVLVSETVHSGEMSYKPQMFLDNGAYNIRLRTKNSIELWSDYTSKTVTIDAVAPVQPTFALYTEQDSVRIVVSREAGTKAAILRSEKGVYEVIAILEDGETDFVDDETKSGVSYTYKVRAYNTGYADSAARSVTFRYEGMYLQSKEETLHLRLVSEENFLPHSESIEREMSIVYYSGREKAVAEYGEHQSKRISKKFFVSYEDKEKLDRICISEQVFCRDFLGNAFSCVVTSPQYTRYKDIGYTVTFDVVEVERDEVIINV